ncbi:MAG: replication protein [Bacteroidetes bacterium]|nr:replication protein [Bacteroidota bacterium]
MSPVQTTPVPNVLFDLLLKDLKASELKILLVIIRQTLGWVDKKEIGGRKSRDWISTSQLERKTGLSRRAISSGLASLIEMGLIRLLQNDQDLLSMKLRHEKVK